jgi:TfoX/Sxy family transcriptional regulator of competence genes
MAVCEELVSRVEGLVADWDGVASSRMFEGIFFLLHGNVFCGIQDDFLLVRLGESSARLALDLEYVQPCDITGRPMAGWVKIPSLALHADGILREWLSHAHDFAKTLPARR